MAGTQVQVEVAREGGAWLDDAEVVAARAVEAAARGCGRALRPGAEVSVLLTDDAAVRTLNARWRGKDAATNVLSFPAVPPEAVAGAPLLGDVALAYETCAREAREEGRPLSHHLAHLCVHGLLHLVGFDHGDEAGGDAMEARETAILASLGVPDPYSDAPAQGAPA